MAMVLSVLKWIGIVILVLLLVLLVTILYLLLLPMHYRFRANCKELDPSVEIRATGFLHFWQVVFKEFGNDYELRVFAFWGKWQVFPTKKKKQKVKEQKAEEVLDASDIEDILLDKDVEPLTEETKKDSRTQKDSKKATKKKKEKKQKKQNSFQWKEIHNKIKDEHNKNAANYIFKKVLWFLKKSKPTIMKADLDYCLGDPALTGMATGVLSLCPGCYGKKVRIIPDFLREEIYFDGWIEIKGIVFLSHIVYLIISIYFNKDCRKLFNL